MRVVIVLVALVTVGAVYSVFDSSEDEFGPGAWARLGAVAVAADTPPDTDPSPTSLAMDTPTPETVDPTSTSVAPTTSSTDTSSTSSTTIPTGDPVRGCAIPGADAPTGRLANVEVGIPEPSAGDAIAVAVEIEEGLAVDGDCVAELVISTLSDERGWAGDGRSFELVDEGARITVTLATPDTVDRLCAPLDTEGFASCWNGSRAMLNLDRWQTGTDEITDTDLYRTYLVNHLVGQALGYELSDCPADGAPAPVMADQTAGLDGCTANPWPLDRER